MIKCLEARQGFTLIEVMVVLALLSALVSVAMVLHQHALAKAQSVEAEVVLEEVRRLETVYYATHGVYSSDLNAIGFMFNVSHKYYKVDLELQQGGTAYRATARPLGASGKQLLLRLTQSRDGQTTLEKLDPTAWSASTGIHSPMNQGVDGSQGGASGSPNKANCRQGGEATVAQDGLLDMNFCLR